MTEHIEDGESSPKSILKKPKQQPKPKCFQWNEENILETYHPVDKTYGHMKIEEPNTPFVFESDEGTGLAYGANFTAEELAARLIEASGSDKKQLPRSMQEEETEEPESTEHREFRDKRRQHYNEFLAAKMANEHIESDDDDDDDAPADPEEDERQNGMDAELLRSAELAAINARINAGPNRARASGVRSNSRGGGSSNETNNQTSRSRSPPTNKSPTTDSQPHGGGKPK